MRWILEWDLNSVPNVNMILTMSFVLASFESGCEIEREHAFAFGLKSEYAYAFPHAFGLKFDIALNLIRCVSYSLIPLIGTYLGGSNITKLGLLPSLPFRTGREHRHRRLHLQQFSTSSFNSAPFSPFRHPSMSNQTSCSLICVLSNSDPGSRFADHSNAMSELAVFGF